MKEELISVIMPAYNREEYVSEAVQSILDQTYTNWELLAIDDGSTDKTGDILDNFEKKDSRIRVFHQKNRGVAAARNIGLANAKGTWTMFLDSDDTYTPDAMDVLLKASDGFDVVIADFALVGSASSKENVEDREFTSQEQIIKENANIIARNRLIWATNWSILFKSSCLTKRYREECLVYEDTVFFADNLKNITKIKTISNVLYNYIRRANNQLTGDWSNHTPKMRAVLNRSIENIFKEENESVQRTLFASFVYGIVKYVEYAVNHPSYNKEQKVELINDALSEDYMEKIPIEMVFISPEMMHLWVIIRTKDIDLIFKEFQNKNV